DIDEMHKDVNDQEVYLEITKNSSNNLFLVLAKDNNISGEGNNVLSEDNAPDVSYSSYHPESSKTDDSIESEQKEKTKFQYEWFVEPDIKESKLNENGNNNLSTRILEIISSTLLKVIFKNIRSEYTPYHLSNKDIIQCHEISKEMAKKVDKNDNDLVLKVFELM
ncbi:5372_t:CDS:2, partial [Diversispora eburnea]